MNTLLITIVITLHTNLMRMDCVEAKDFDSAEVLLKENNKSLRDFDRQLLTNGVFVYELQSGSIILIPAGAESDRKAISCLLFKNKRCFDDCIENDSFPIENFNKVIYEYDVEGLRNINKNIDKYHQYLNTRLSLNHPTADKNNIQDYYNGVMRMKTRKEQDILALGAIMGEVQRKELNGRWVLEKWYGAYNPYFKPLIVYSDENKIVFPYDKLIGMIKWKEKDASKFFFILPGKTPTLDSRKKERIIELQ